jgi:beta-galactosidase/beta-glucuronidase
MIRAATNADRAKVPIVLTEYHPGGGGHVGGEDKNWDVMWPTDAFAGAFIWEWQDQGMYDKFPERWSIPAPGAKSNPTNGYRVSGARGAVTAERKPTDIFDVLKPLYSPVHAVAGEVTTTVAANQDWPSQCVVAIQNRYSFTDLSELTCRWQALAGGKIIAGGEGHIAAKPRTSVDASFPFLPGMDTLRLEFIHPDGRSLYMTSLKAKVPQ